MSERDIVERIDDYVNLRGGENALNLLRSAKAEIERLSRGLKGAQQVMQNQQNDVKSHKAEIERLRDRPGLEALEGLQKIHLDLKEGELRDLRSRLAQAEREGQAAVTEADELADQAIRFKTELTALRRALEKIAAYDLGIHGRVVSIAREVLDAARGEGEEEEKSE